MNKTKFWQISSPEPNDRFSQLSGHARSVEKVQPVRPEGTIEEKKFSGFD